MRSETCSRCGEEMRFGYRNDTFGWWHRENVDHHPGFGVLGTPAEWAASKAAIAAKLGEEAEEEVGQKILPPPEITATPVEKTDPRVPRGARTLVNLAEREGWACTLTYSRGPYVHSTTDEVLGVRDCVVLRLAKVVDDTELRAVAWWREKTAPADHPPGEHAGYELKGAWIWHPLSKANSDQLKAWIRQDGE